MNPQSFTEGALRALSLAARLAREGGAEAVTPLHLLWSLALDESRAAETLAAHGVTLDALRVECPLPSAAAPSDEDTSGDVSSDESGVAAADGSLPHSDRLREVLVSARRHVGHAGRSGEIGTEYILCGLAEVVSEVTPLFRRRGLEPSRLAEHAVAVSGLHSQPLDVDFAITWQDRTQDELTDTLRTLDAAANRAREGLRVVEDYVRFTLDDAHLTELAKHCRHDLTAALAPLDGYGLVAARDTQGDVGTGIRTNAERRRDAPRDVLTANLKRVQEATRSLEEFGKVISPEMGESLGRLRYRLYTLEKAILLTDANRNRLADVRLYLLVTEDLCHHGSGPAVREAVAHGVGVVQVREKGMADRALLAHGRRVVDWARSAGALCIVNDRPDLAVLADADGVHVGQDELTVRDARRIVGPNRLVGVSTHTIEQARQAVVDGADYLGVGPVFPSGTKQFDALAGLAFVRQVAAEISLPWFAIGGVTPANIDQVLAAGATRVAVSGAICRAENPGAEAVRLREKLTTRT